MTGTGSRGNFMAPNVPDHPRQQASACRRRLWIGWLDLTMPTLSATGAACSLCAKALQGGYDIRTVQELLGHKDVSTTMIYTHVLNKGGRGVKSALGSGGGTGFPPVARDVTAEYRV